jgi:hypothetical protein
MGEDFRNRLRDADPVGVFENGVAGWVGSDGVFVEDEGYDSTEHDWYGEADQDPANDPSQEFTFVRDQAL